MVALQDMKPVGCSVFDRVVYGHSVFDRFVYGRSAGYEGHCQRKGEGQLSGRRSTLRVAQVSVKLHNTHNCREFYPPMPVNSQLGEMPFLLTMIQTEK